MAGKPSFHVGMPRGNSGASRALYQQAQTGFAQIQRNFAAFCEWLTLDVTPDAMVEALEPTMDLSDAYAPKDTHRMVNSRYNKVRKNRSGVLRAEVGYNKNGEAPYTVFVHEMPQFYHTPPTRYKFLQSALDETTPEIVGRLAASIKRRSGL